MSSKPGTLAAIALLALATPSCTRATSPLAERVAIRTDAERYVMRPGPYGDEATIVAMFTAPPDTTVQIMNCNGAIAWGLQKRVDNQWEDAWAAVTNQCLSPPIILAPRGVFVDTLTLAVTAGGTPSGERDIEPGTYRVVWYNVLTAFDPEARPFGPELALENRVSRPITIERSP
jgi:hypothetical protein